MTEYRLKAGHVTAANINADANAIVANFPRTAPSGAWNVETTGIISYGTARRVTGDGRVVFNGNVVLPPWRIIASKTNADYIITTIFSGAQAALVTIKTYDVIRDEWQVFRTTASIDLIAPNFVNVNDTWLNKLEIAFVPGTVAPAS